MDEGNAPKEVKEGLGVLNAFYGFDQKKDKDRYIQKGLFRDDAYRMAVINFHLSIEEMLKSLVYSVIARRKVFSKKQNIEYLDRLGFKQLIDLAARAGILNKKGHTELARLNDIRNKCSHNWTLHTYKMAPYKNARKRKYRVEFNGKNLLNLDVMRNDFMPLYGDIYVELFAVNYGLRRKRIYTLY